MVHFFPQADSKGRIADVTNTAWKRVTMKLKWKIKECSLGWEKKNE
jgi:hypothetical protein